MVENIQIINKNGDVMQVESIAYIALQSGKNYLFYTLNEKVDNDLTKIYIAETSANPGEANPIDPEAWDDLRKKMVKLSHKEEIPDITFLNITETQYNVGEAKKLAVTSVAKQTFKDVQIAHTLSADANEVPATTGSFFDNTDLTQPTAVEAAPQEPSIFEQPIQPVISESAPVAEPIPVENAFNAAPTEVATPAVEPTPVVEQPAAVPAPPVEAAPQPMPAPAVEQPVQPLPAEPTPVPAPPLPVEAPPMPEVAPPPIEPTPVEAPIAPAPTVEQPVQPLPAEPTPVPAPPTSEVVAEPAPSVVAPIEATPQPPKEAISDEEALKAINVIQAYLDQESQEN